MSQINDEWTPPWWRERLQRLRVPLGFVTAFLFLLMSHPTLHSLAWGVPVALLGVWIRAWAAGHLRKNAELAVSGPYAYTRNPLYFGSFVMTTGLAVSGGVVWLGVWLLVFFLLVYLPVMQAEAEHMTRLFGQAYIDWAKSLPLFLPRLTPYRIEGLGNQQGRFEWRLYRHNREYRALLGMFLVLDVLVLKMLFRNW
jgi:protein-S-isoprenylcysteine O-methyltransferase Ste14